MKDYQIIVSVDASLQNAFNSINQVTKWWTENLKGSSQKLNDEFSVYFGDIHYSKQKLVEVIPDKKVVWLVTDSRLNFIDNKEEWTNTRISFELTAMASKTKIVFTHLGLTSDIECYNACSGAWADYIKGSLVNFINTGRGTPTPRE